MKRQLNLPGAYPGFQRGGCLRLGPIRKVGGGGGGGGAIRFRSDTKSGGGGGSPRGPPPPPPPPGSYASETVTILTKGVLKHFANELICRV